MSIQSISRFIPEYKQITATAEEVVKTTSEVAIGIFSATFYYAIENLPSLIYYSIHEVQPAWIASITHSNQALGGAIWGLITSGEMISLGNLSGYCSNTDSAIQFIQLIAAAATVTELCLVILCPPSLGVQLTVKGIVLFASFVGNGRTIQKGCMKIHEGIQGNNLKLSEKVSRVVLGLFSVGIGVAGSITTIKTAKKLLDGLKVYQTLDETQKFYALKYQGLTSLGQVKTQKAIIINGVDSEWAEPDNYYSDNTPDVEAYVIYQNYETRVYKVTSTEDFSAIFDRATKDMGGKLDLVCLDGHSNPMSIDLNKEYTFRANPLEIETIQRNIKHDGEVLLWGCNTAKYSMGIASITEKISKMLPSNKITGFSEKLYPSSSWAWYEGKLRINAWNRNFSSIVKVFKNGIQVAA